MRRSGRATFLNDDAEASGAGGRSHLTPMVDVVFLLIIFFMLVAQITKRQGVTLDLAQLEDASTRRITEQRTFVVSVIPRERTGEYAGGAYLSGGAVYERTPAGLGRLRAHFAGAVRDDPAVRVFVRAARDERFERVQPVLRAAAEAGVREVAFVTARDRTPGAYEP